MANPIFNEVVNTSRRVVIALMKFLLAPENENQMDGWLKIYEPLVDAVSVWKPHNWLNGINHRTVDEDNKGSCGRPFNSPL